MKAIAPILLVFLFPVLTYGQQWHYPPTRQVDASDTYFGTTYKDPYRWLENLKDKEVQTWFKDQSKLADDALSKIPGRTQLVTEWLALDKLKPASYGDIVVENGRVFYKKALGGENIGKLYYRDGYDGAEKLLFDPATYSKDGKSVVQSFIPSWDAKHVVLGISAGGAEYSQLRVLDVEKSTLLPDKIEASWGARDGRPTVHRSSMMSAKPPTQKACRSSSIVRRASTSWRGR